MNDISTAVKRPARKATGFDPYQMLGILPHATPDAIKAAYKRRVRETHPDITKQATEAEFHDVCRAWSILSDPEKRRIYDETGQLPDDIDKERMEVAATLATMFDQALTTVLSKGKPLKTVNFVQAITDAVSEGLRRAVGNLSKIGEMKKDLEDLRKRIRRSDDAENAFSAHLTRKITECDQAMANHRHEKRIAELMLVELGNYTNEVELVMTMTNFSSFSSSSSGWTRW